VRQPPCRWLDSWAWSPRSIIPALRATPFEGLLAVYNPFLQLHGDADDVFFVMDARG
jgi:hypothetical protein